MYKYILLAILCLFIWIGQANATITVVHIPDSGLPDSSCGEAQGVSSMNIGSGSDSTPTAGSTWILFINYGATSTSDHIASITNNSGTCISGAGCVWTFVSGSRSFDPGNGGEEIWYGSNPASGTSGASVAITGTAGVNFIGACMMEVTGLNTGGTMVDAVATSTAASSIAGTTPSIQGNYNSELFIAISACQNTFGTPKIDSPWTAVGPTNAVGGCPGGFLITNSTGPHSATMNQSSAGTWAFGIASFIGAGASSSYSNSLLLPE